MDIRELAKRTGYIPTGPSNPPPIKSKPVIRAHNLGEKRPPGRPRKVIDLNEAAQERKRREDEEREQDKRYKEARLQAKLERARLIKEQREKRRRWGGYYRRMDAIDVRVSRIHLRRAKLKKLIDALDREVRTLLEERKGLVAAVGELPAQEPATPPAPEVVSDGPEAPEPDQEPAATIEPVPQAPPEAVSEPATPEPAPVARPQYRYCVNCLHLKSVCTCGAQ